MKGQYLAIEYVLFIAIGVAMVIVVYSIFTNISNTIEGGTTQAQIERTAELIRSMIVNTYEVAHRTNSQIIYNLGLLLFYFSMLFCRIFCKLKTILL